MNLRVKKKIKKFVESIFYSVLCAPKIENDFINSIMSQVCQITGKSVMGGHNVSHSKRRTKRKYYPNLFVKKFYIPEEDSWITLKVSAAGLRTINKNGISASLNEAIDKGFIK